MSATRVDPNNPSTFPSGFYRLSSPDGSVKCLKMDGSKRYIAGYANVAEVIDSQDEVVGIDVLKDAWNKWKSNPEFCILTLLHSNIPIAKVVFDPVTDSEGNVYKSGVDDKGLYLVAEVRDDIQIANDTWAKIQSGELRGYSIGGQNVIPPVRECKNGKCFRRLKGIELHETGIVPRPANRVSLFTMLKSDTLERLSEITNEIHDSVLKDSVVKVSKQPDIEGKYHLFVEGGKDCPIYKMVSDCLLRSNESVTKSTKVVDEMDVNVEYVPLFDLALLRPFSVKSDSPLTEGGGMVALTPSPTHEPMVGEPTMNEKKEDCTPNAPTEVPVEVKPSVDEKPIAPLTMETLAADIAQMREKLDELTKAEYPWDECIADRLKDGYSQPQAERICGAIRSRTIGKDGSKATWDSFLADLEKADIAKGLISKSEKTEEKPCGCAEKAKVDAPVIVAPTAPPAQVIAPAPVVEAKAETPKPEIPVAIPSPPPEPAPVPVVKVEPVVTVPMVEVKPIPPVTVPTEPTIIQRGKSIPDKTPAGLDLESINKMSWRELNRLRG